MEAPSERKSMTKSSRRPLAVLALGILLALSGASGAVSSQINAKKATPAAAGPASTISRSFALQANGRVNIDVLLPAAGKLEARAEWAGTATTLALILNGPGQSQAYARRDGMSPLLLAFDISPALFAKGNAWRLSVVNFGTGSAQVQVTIRLPASTATAADTTQTRQATATAARTATAKAQPSKAPAPPPVAGKAQAGAVSQLHTGPVVWSVQSQLQRPAAEKGRPPYVGEQVDSLVPAKNAQFKTARIQVNRRQPLAYQPFEVVDPRNGNAITPDAVLPPFPNGKTMRAADYYNDLNILESQFNALGFTLDVRRDPSPGARLQETQFSAAQAAQVRKAGQDFIGRHRRLSVAKPLGAAEARQQFLRQQSADRLRLQRLIKDRSEEPPALSPSGYVPPPAQTGNDFKYDYSTDLPTLGDRDLFAIYLEGSAELSGKKPGVYAIPGTNAVQAGGSIQLKAHAEAGGYVFDNKFALIRVDGNATAPSPGGEMGAKVTLYIAGMATRDLINCPAQTYSSTTKLTDLPHKDFTAQWEKSLDLSYTTPIPIGPFVITLRAGVRATAGIEGGIYLSPLGASARFGPYVRADVYASAGISLLIAEAGVKVTLTLINNSLVLEGSVGLTGELEAGEGSLKIAYSLRLYDEFQALSGSLGVYVCVYVPAFDIPPWHQKCWDWDIISWEGWKATGDLFDPVTGSWDIFTGGAIGGPSGGTFKPSGSGGVTWDPDGMSCLLPLNDTSKGVFAPSVVEFNGQLHAFWLDGWTVQYAGLDPTVLTSVETKEPGTTGAAAQGGGGGRSRYGNVKQRLGGTLNTTLGPYPIVTWSAPVAVVFRERIYLFHAGWPAGMGNRKQPDQAIYYHYMDSSGKWWPENPFGQQLPGASYYHPAAAVYKGDLYLFFLQSGGKGIYYMRFRPGILSADKTTDIVLMETKLIPGNVQALASPAACAFGDRLYVFHRGSGNSNIYYRYLDPSGQWGPEETEETKVEGSSSTDGPAVGVAGEQIIIVYRRMNSSIHYRFGAMGNVASTSGGGGGGLSGQYGQKKQRLSSVDIVWLDEQEITGNTKSDRGPTVCPTPRKFFMFHVGKDDFKLLYKWFSGY